LHLGGSRAFLRDGVLQFKKKRGLRVVGNSNRGFLIRPLSASAGLKGFLLRNPFIYIDQGKLHGAVFVENHDDCCNKSLEQYRKSFSLSGISMLNVYQFKKHRSGMGMTISPSLSDKIAVRSINPSFRLVP
jgi:hypothetical protein